MEEIEAIMRLGGKVPTTVDVSEKVDDRKNRFYGRKILVSMKLATEWDRRHEVPSSASVMRYLWSAATQPQKLGIVALDGHRLRVDADSTWYLADSVRLSFGFIVMATRPSKTISESDASVLSDTIVAALQSALIRACEEKREAKRQERAVEQAKGLIQWGAFSAVRRAKTACRFEQRLAALMAELASEVTCQTAMMREERAIETEAGDKFEPEAVQYAAGAFETHAKHLAEVVGKPLADRTVYVTWPEIEHATSAGEASDE